jgi:hypothetical protein
MRKYLFWVGLAVPALFNIDSIEIGKHLVDNPTLRAMLADQGARVAKAEEVDSKAS